MRRVQRAERPGDRRDDDRGEARPDRARRPRRAIVGPTRIATPDEADHDPDTGEPRQRFAEEDAPEDRDPDRHHRDEQRRDARRDRLLAEGDHAHAAAEQERADDDRVAPLAAGRHDEAIRGLAAATSPAGPHPAIAKRTAAIRKGGIVSTAIAIAEVGRAPDQVEDEQPEPDRPAVGRGLRLGWHRQMVQVHSIRRRRVGKRGSSRSGRRARPGPAWTAGSRRPDWLRRRAQPPSPAGRSCTADSRPRPRPGPSGSRPGARR